MAFWRCYYYVIRATKNCEALIYPQHENLIFEAIRRKSTELGCEVFGVNGMPDHIHVAVSMPPTLAIADWVKHVKGISSREWNAALPNLPLRFRWQDSYSVLTFGKRNLSFVLDYIAQQKEHHANNRVYAYLEHLEAR